MQVLALLAAGHQNYDPQPDMSAAVDALIASSATAAPAPASFRLGQGVWEVHPPCSHVGNRPIMLPLWFGSTEHTRQCHACLSRW